MSAQAGVRERKKRQTQERIAATARRLFAQRGFDRVTVAEIARQAHVAQNTVFNHFPTKEDIFSTRLESFEEGLLAAIGERAPGRSIVDAFRGFLLTRWGAWERIAPGDPEALAELRTGTRIVSESRALLAREEQIFSRCTVSLAALLAEEMGRDEDDVEARVVANALVGVHRALVDHVRRCILAGETDLVWLRRDLRIQTMRALRPIEDGLDGYGAGSPTPAGDDASSHPPADPAPAYTRPRWRSSTSERPAVALGAPASGVGRSRSSEG
jgi:AcrR family transcriptional regulator